VSQPVSDLFGIKVLGSCYPPCPERLWAVVEGSFGPAKSLGGWVFREGPWRRLDDTAKWRAVYYGQDQPDHTGEPYVFTQCPWCGKDLAPPPDDEGLEDEQADGC
jgi:hypothetical protein